MFGAELFNYWQQPHSSPNDQSIYQTLIKQQETYLTLVQQLFKQQLGSNELPFNILPELNHHNQDPHAILMQQLCKHWQQIFALLQQSLFSAASAKGMLQWQPILQQWIPAAELAFTQMINETSFQQAFGESINLWLKQQAIPADPKP